MFTFLKNQLSKIYAQVTSRISSLFSHGPIDAATLKELKNILISADTGATTTQTILDHLTKQWQSGAIREGADLKKALQELLCNFLVTPTPFQESSVYLLVGVNGSGKTTCAAKLAHRFSKQGKSVLLVAADTFRAAATEQLQQWSIELKIPIVVGNPKQDPASVVFVGCEQYKKEQIDILIIDTAGRLQTKTNLMRELEKVKNNITRHLPDTLITTLLTIDAMLGQNSLEQARLFYESTNVQGVVLTKMDGTGKGGIVFAITQELGIPIRYISYGERPDSLRVFDPQEYVASLLDDQR
jgi:fused signal recognition particle receptor